VQTLIDWTKRTCPDDARVAAIVALGKLAQASVVSQQKKILQTLNGLADEDSFRIRIALVVGLAATESPHAIEILNKVHALEIDPRVRRNALAAIDALQTGGSATESVMKLKSALEKVEEDQKKLRSLFEEARKPH
jgi:HEAT repeat protein